MRKANAVSTLAHTAVLRNVKRAKNERELEAVFVGECLRNGAGQAYHAIVAGGRLVLSFLLLIENWGGIGNLTFEERNLLT